MKIQGSGGVLVEYGQERRLRHHDEARRMPSRHREQVDHKQVRQSLLNKEAALCKLFQSFEFMFPFKVGEKSRPDATTTLSKVIKLSIRTRGITFFSLFGVEVTRHQVRQLVHKPLPGAKEV